MKHGSLFSGIGGFDLAASWIGWENVFQVEIDPFCNYILEKHFPETKRHRDIKAFDGTEYKNQIDIISGGFPCQPFSSNGKRKGTTDERYLWPEMLRIIREVRPRYLVGENVPGIVPDPFEQVCLDLEAEGYAVWPVIIPALAVGALHRRDRVWIVANATNHRCTQDYTEALLQDTPPTRLAGGLPLQVWDEPLPSPTGFCGVPDGIPDRVDRLYALGNAIVPQVAYYIFGIIRQHDRYIRA
jgi:DNA-cytosine methyltransferase